MTTTTETVREQMIEAAVIRNTDEIKSDTARELLARVNMSLTADAAFTVLLTIKRTPKQYSEDVWPSDGQISYQESLSLEYLAIHKRRALQRREMYAVQPCEDCGSRNCGC